MNIMKERIDDLNFLFTFYRRVVLVRVATSIFAREHYDDSFY